MSTSGSTDWNLTRDEIIAEAAELVGASALGKTPSDAVKISFSRTLNALVKGLQRDPNPVVIYVIEEKTVDLVAGQEYIALDSGTVAVHDDAWILAGGIRFPVKLRSRKEFDAHLIPGSETRPDEMMVDFSTDPPIAHFYYTPNSAYELHYVRDRILEDFDSATDNADMPQEAVEMLIAGLAYKVSKKYGIPSDERREFLADFEQAKKELKASSARKRGISKQRPTGMVV